MPAKTPFYNFHKQLSAKIVDFGGWDMPLSYQSVLKEHQQVRNHCGIFDVSHMGEIFVSGPEAVPFLQLITINDIGQLKVGQGQYTAMCTETGGIVDDLICYRLKDQEYLLCVNASNTEKDFAWIQQQSKPFQQVTIKNESDQWSQIAIQGPESQSMVESLISPTDLPQFKDLAYSEIMTAHNRSQAQFYIARTGYTGELGYEIYAPNGQGVQIWQELLERKAVPIGLGARDTLRLEACFLLYGNDINETITPVEAGISWAIKWDAKDFIGKNALLRQRKEGVLKKVQGFEMIDKAIPRSHMTLSSGDREVGYVTSGSVLPSLNANGGLCYVDSNIQIGDEILVDVRGNRKRAKIVKRPFYQTKVRKNNSL